MNFISFVIGGQEEFYTFNIITSWFFYSIYFILNWIIFVFDTLYQCGPSFTICASAQLWLGSWFKLSIYFFSDYGRFVISFGRLDWIYPIKYSYIKFQTICDLYSNFCKTDICFTFCTMTINSIYPHSATLFAAISATVFAIIGILGKYSALNVSSVLQECYFTFPNGCRKCHNYPSPIKKSQYTRTCNHSLYTIALHLWSTILFV